MVTTLAIRRRTLVERQAIALLRGADMAARPASRAWQRRVRTAAIPTPVQARHFTVLRELADRYRFTILDPAAPYVGADELRLLAWLAEAQRALGLASLSICDPAFAAALLRCASLLDGMGLHLSPLTLYSARLRAPAQRTMPHDGSRNRRKSPNRHLQEEAAGYPG